MTQPKTTFANGVNCFSGVGQTSLRKVLLDDVCAFFKRVNRISTTYEVTKHFNIPSSRVSKLIAGLHKRGCLEQTRKSGHGGKYGYRYIKDVKEEAPRRSLQILAHITDNPRITAMEVTANIGGGAAGDLLSRMYTRGDVTREGVFGSYRYSAA